MLIKFYYREIWSNSGGEFRKNREWRVENRPELNREFRELFRLMARVSLFKEPVIIGGIRGKTLAASGRILLY
jgi:hypothetical protein